MSGEYLTTPTCNKKEWTTASLPRIHCKGATCERSDKARFGHGKGVTTSDDDVIQGTHFEKRKGFFL